MCVCIQSDSRFLQSRSGSEILMLRFSTTQHPVPAVPRRLGAQWNVGVAKPDLLHAVRREQTRALSSKHTLEKAAIGRPGHCRIWKNRYTSFPTRTKFERNLNKREIARFFLSLSGKRGEGESEGDRKGGYQGDRDKRR